MQTHIQLFKIQFKSIIFDLVCVLVFNRLRICFRFLVIPEVKGTGDRFKALTYKK